MRAKRWPRRRGGFADPEGLVSAALGLVAAGLLLPLARREGWLGWLLRLTMVILVLPFVLLVLTSVYDRIRATAAKIAARHRRLGASENTDEAIDEKPLQRGREPDDS